MPWAASSCARRLRAAFDLGVAQASLAAHERFAVRDGVGDRLPEVRKVEFHRQKKSVPPSTGIVAPTTKLESSEHRNTTTGATSSGSPTRPMSFEAP